MRNFLGTKSQGTVIIIKKVEGHPTPSLKRMRELFAGHAFAMYQSDGWYCEEIGQIQEMLRSVSIYRGGNSDHRDYYSNFYFYTENCLPANSFFISAYAPVTHAALFLTDKCMEDLRKLLYLHYQIKNERNSVQNFIQNISRNAELAKNKSINDPTMLHPEIDGLRELLNGYGDIAYKTVCDDLESWRSSHTWK